jgi:hypothetical protein
VQLLMSALYFVTALVQGQEYQPEIFGALLASAFVLTVIVFCVGVFAWLWLFAPVSAGLRLGSVIARGLLAVVVGGAITFVATFCIQMQAWFAGANFFSNSLSQASESFARDGGNAFAFAVSSSVQLAVSALPLTVLAVVLTWSWLVRHPARQSAIAVAAEV